jgi:DNA-binding transcriptional LysR family regulator
MNTQFLNTFVVVVDKGSMASAARQLNIAPATVAQQIHSLEREIGTLLITRCGRTVTVTEAGARILERARVLLGDVADLHTVANDDVTAGELRLGAGSNALIGMLPDILALMVTRFPGINVYIERSTSVKMYPLVEAGELDAAIVMQGPFSLSKRIGWKLLREEPLVLLAPASMAGRDPHELLRNEPLIRYDRNHWGGHQADRYLRAVGITPHERFELNALNAIAVMVDRGLGVSLVPNWARPWPEGLRLVTLELPHEFEPNRVGVIWSRSTIRIRLVNAFIEEAQRAMLPQLSSSDKARIDTELACT